MNVHAGEIQAFYDQFSKKLLQDYVWGNRRIERQLDFFRAAIPRGARRILVIGSGSGYATRFIARKVAPHARILAVDISDANIAVARSTFAHRRVEYKRLDVVNDPLPGNWDVIALPDVYEHIAVDSRPILHARLRPALAERGIVVLTYPSPAHQAMLRESGQGLQVIDEDVSLGDLLALARDLGANVTHYALISVWGTNDYVHAVLERHNDKVEPLEQSNRLRIKNCPQKSYEWWRSCFGRAGLSWLPLRSLKARMGSRQARATGFLDAMQHQ